MERFTFKKTNPYYKPGEESPCIVAKDLIVITEYDSMDDVFSLEFRPKEYVASPAIDRLYDYEELGHTPNELRILLEQRDNLEDLADDATDLLNKYEELGYTPEELRDIISKYERYERLVKSPNGLTIEDKPDKLNHWGGSWKEFVNNVIERASSKKDVSVSAMFHGDYVSVSVYPWPEEEPDDNT